jgi:superfamily II DNA or RNA helicase
MLQNFRIGDRVRVRGARWAVAEVCRHDACCLLTLSGADETNRGVPLQLLTPFDTLERIAAGGRVRTVGPARWRRACRRVLASTGTPDALTTAATSHIDLFPHQLEPALAIVRGRSSRVLIADEVGLGKTVQAALVTKELLARGAAARVLVLTPAGLRDQWIEECRSRFDLPLTLVDATDLRRRRAMLPPGLNPWSTEPLVVASLDFVKRPEVLPAVQACRWDIVIVDEAHHAAGRHDRHRAVATLAARAAYVLLLTATPHNGDQDLFDSLRDLGGHDDPLVMFRRTRRDIGRLPERRVHLLPVRCTRAEQLMHSALTTFIRAVECDHGATSDVRLAVSMLQKRALSSAFALWQSVERRLRSLKAIDEESVTQLMLPIEDHADLDVADTAPPWTVPSLTDRRTEHRLLARLCAAARQASGRESKLHAVSTLLRRVREPVLLFTEYRDTLEHVRRTLAPDAPVIHGGLDREQRRAALHDFRTAPLMLATDAAGEGLNLQQRCRIVVSLELPWNPVRLEQRIGRVDRIGQTRRVHVYHLMAAGTFEERIRQRLEGRITRTRAEVGRFDPFGTDPDPGTAPPGATRLTAEAATEHRRLARARRLLTRTDIGPRDSVGPRHLTDGAETLVWFSKRRQLRSILGPGALFLVQTLLTGESGRIIASHLTPVRLPRTNDLRGPIEWLAAHVGRHAGTSRAEWLEASERIHHTFWDTRLRRERAIARTSCVVQAEQQPGLFDGRFDARHDEWCRLVREARTDADARERAVRQMVPVAPVDRPVLALVL